MLLMVGRRRPGPARHGHALLRLQEFLLAPQARRQLDDDERPPRPARAGGPRDADGAGADRRGGRGAVAGAVAAAFWRGDQAGVGGMRNPSEKRIRR